MGLRLRRALLLALLRLGSIPLSDGEYIEPSSGLVQRNGMGTHKLPALYDFPGSPSGLCSFTDTTGECVSELGSAVVPNLEEVLNCN